MQSWIFFWVISDDFDQNVKHGGKKEANLKPDRKVAYILKPLQRKQRNIHEFMKCKYTNNYAEVPWRIKVTIVKKVSLSLHETRKDGKEAKTKEELYRSYRVTSEGRKHIVTACFCCPNKLNSRVRFPHDFVIIIMMIMITMMEDLGIKRKDNRHIPLNAKVIDLVQLLRILFLLLINSSSSLSPNVSCLLLRETTRPSFRGCHSRRSSREKILLLHEGIYRKTSRKKDKQDDDVDHALDWHESDVSWVPVFLMSSHRLESRKYHQWPFASSLTALQRFFLIDSDDSLPLEFFD